MRILVSGASGLIGRVLLPFLVRQGHDVTRLVRSRERSGEGAIYWNPATREIDRTRLDGFDAAIHLAAENIGAHRWTEERKRRIHDSRVAGTRLLAEALAAQDRPPRVLISTSAIGYYGERGDDSLTESEPPGPDFLCQVVRDWEAAADPARERGLRVVHPRLGVVLSPAGGALKRFLVPFRFGVGGPLAGGRQWFSWIALEDAVRVFHHLLITEALTGPVNAVAPEPIRQRDFAATLGRVLGKPSWLNVPRVALNVRLGPGLAASILQSQRVLPKKLAESGFVWQLPDLEGALRTMLTRG